MNTDSIVPQAEISFPNLRLTLSITGWIASLYEVVHPQNRGRPKVYSLTQILSILVLKEFSRQSFRSMGDWFYHHPEYLFLCGLDQSPSFQTLSYRCARMGVHGLIKLSVFLFRITRPFYVFFRIGAVDGIVVNPCKDHRAQFQRKQRYYHDPNTSWTVSTKQQWEYGYKTVIGCDVVSGLILGYRFFTAKVHEMNGLRYLTSCFKTLSYLLLDAAKEVNFFLRFNRLLLYFEKRNHGSSDYRYQSKEYDRYSL